MKKKTFRRQLIRSYLLIVCTVFIVISVIMLVGKINSMQQQTKNELTATAELTSSQFGFVVKNMSFISTYILSNRNFVQNMTLLSKSDLSNSAYLEAYNTVQSALVNYSLVSSIYRATFFNENGYIATSDQYNLKYSVYDRLNDDEINSVHWLYKVQDNYGEAVLLPVQQRNFSHESYDTLMLVRAVRNPGKIVGYLIVDVHMSDVEEIIRLNPEQTLILVNENEEVLYSKGELPDNLVNENLCNIEYWDQLGFFSSTVTDVEQKLTTIVISPKSELIRNLSKQISVYLIEGALLLSVSIALILLISKRLTKPLNVLGEQMKQTDLNTLRNNTDDYSALYQYAETESLYKAFTEMRERLDTLINREITWKTQQVEQRLHNLQAQINPHFMYNTLNMIGIMGYESGNREIFDACNDFSNLMRYSISDKLGNTSSIGEEIIYVQNYLSLMQMRFEKACSYDIHQDKIISNEKIPRLTLQPFIENIFEHAYDGNTESVFVKVTTTVVEERWYIIIEDNGCGMTSENLEKLKNEIKDYLLDGWQNRNEKPEKGIGMKNSLSRLNLFYSGTFQYEIASETSGFRVVLSAIRKADNLK